MLRRLAAWLFRQLLILAASTGLMVVWFEVLLWLAGVEPSPLSYVFIVLASLFLPVLTILEAAGRGMFGKEYRMDVPSSFVLASLLGSLPFTAIYLYFIGECVRCEESYWDGALVTLLFAVPASVFQWAAYRVFTRRKTLLNVDTSGHA
jgi:hypothetical protein